VVVESVETTASEEQQQKQAVLMFKPACGQGDFHASHELTNHRITIQISFEQSKIEEFLMTISKEYAHRSSKPELYSQHSYTLALKSPHHVDQH
jgi:hypothetical protein